MKFKLQLAFLSFVTFTSIAGLCFGIGFIPFCILFNLKNVDSGNVSLITVIFLSIVASPILFTINGVLAGIIGYPMYKWLTAKVGVVYEGNVYADD
jgi:hypothetical protein